MARSSDGTSIAYDRSGAGPAVVLVAGALSDRSTARPLSGQLAATFSVFAYDRRGRGDSGDTAPYAVEREIEDLDAVVRMAGGTAFVFGHSSGAALAMRAAAAGVSMQRLALYEPPFMVDDSRALPPADYASRLTTALAQGRRGDALELFMTIAVQTPPDAVAQMRQSPYWSGMEAMAGTLAYDQAVMEGTMTGGPLPAAWARSITLPVLAMDGGASPSWARHAVEAVAALLPDTEHRTLDGQGHGADPGMVAAELRRFFLA